MKLFENFVYQPLERVDGGPGGRLYVTPTGERLPSVTTILEATKSDESRAGLAQWRKRVGEQQAKQITEAAAGRGTRMHTYLERWIKDDHRSAPTNPLARDSWRMSQVVIDQGLKHVDQFWGVEIPLYYEGLYAGTTDCVGLWKGRPAILDFKQTNKPKKREWIDDYMHQLCAYMLAHDKMHNTQLECGIILMCVAPKSRDETPQYQEFVLEGSELDYYKDQWWQRVAEYYMRF